MDLCLKKRKNRQNEIDNLNSPITVKEIEFVIKKFLRKKLLCSFQCNCI